SGAGPSPAISMMVMPASGPDPGAAGALTSSLSRREADCTVEPDRFAVQHLVVDDVEGKGGIFGRLAQARREGHCRTERILHILRHARHHRRLENAWRNRHHADAR